MNPAARILQLLEDYGRLISDEAVALRDGNFEKLSEIQALMPQILDRAVEIGIQHKVNRENSPEIQGVLEKLEAASEANAALTEELLTKAQVERENIDAGRHRLRKLSQAYVMESDSKSNFSHRV